MGIWSFFSRKFNKKDAKRNSITVKAVYQDYPFDLDNNNGKIFTFNRGCPLDVVGVRHFPAEGIEREFMMSVMFKKGFQTDGASAPDIFKCVVPHYKDGNDLYNAAPFIHDGLYVWGGEVQGLDENLSREECDDFLREIWGLAGMKREIRGIADKGIEFVAGSEDHWGPNSDDLQCKHLFVAKWQYR